MWFEHLRHTEEERFSAKVFESEMSDEMDRIPLWVGVVEYAQRILCVS